MIERVVLKLALFALPPSHRTIRAEEWSADLHFAEALGLSRASLLWGIVRVAGQSARLRRWVGVTAFLLVGFSVTAALYFGVLTLIETAAVVTLTVLLFAPVSSPEDTGTLRSAGIATLALFMLTSFSRHINSVDLQHVALKLALTVAFATFSVAAYRTAVGLFASSGRLSRGRVIAAATGTALVVVGLLTIGLRMSGGTVDAPTDSHVLGGAALFTFGFATIVLALAVTRRTSVANDHH